MMAERIWRIIAALGVILQEVIEYLQHRKQESKPVSPKE